MTSTSAAVTGIGSPRSSRTTGAPPDKAGVPGAGLIDGFAAVTALACDDRRREGGPRQLGGSVLLPISPPAEASAGVLENPAASRTRPRTFVGEVLRAVAEQGGDPRRVGRSGPRKPSGRFNARGRGRDAAASLAGHGGWKSASGEPWTGGMRYRARRVVVKARVVKLKGVDSRAIAAHLRCLQREGVTTDGQHG
jgi:hypothetical protein